MLNRLLPTARAPTSAPLLLRLDSDHDAPEGRVRAEIERIDFLIKWNPHQTDPGKALAQAEALGAAVHWETPRLCKRVGTFSVRETRSWQGTAYTHRRVTQVLSGPSTAGGRPCWCRRSRSRPGGRPWICPM